MKKLRYFGLALACISAILTCLVVGRESVGTDVISHKPETVAANQGQKDNTKPKDKSLSRRGGVAVGNRSITVSDELSKSAIRPYFKRAADAVITPDGSKQPLRIYHAMTLPNDPSASQSWVTLANINSAWDIPRGDNPTLLAIIDTGFALQHEEFQGRWHANSGEIADNAIDDDGNGLVDDTRGWDFANNDADVQAQAEGRHGTFVSGVAAATGNNGKGIAGVDWGTDVLPIQALGEDGEGYNSDVANGIVYAADQGADVISLSLGSETPDSVVRQAVDYAISKGAVVVAAAGNDGCNCMVYPANYPETVAVGATDNSNQRASFSSYGTNLDIMAPGVNLYTTDWQVADPTGAYTGGISGTSLSTPIVSGLLTRLKSQQPSSTPLQLIAALTRATNRLSLGAGVTRSDAVGFGLTNGGQATQRMTTSYTPSQMYTFNPISLGLTLSPGSPAEKSAGDAMAYRCDNSRPGTTPVYELAKISEAMFTVSPSEANQAAGQGYSSGIFGYACLTMPQDNPAQTVQDIGLHKIWDLTGSH